MFDGPAAPLNAPIAVNLGDPNEQLVIDATRTGVDGLPPFAVSFHNNTTSGNQFAAGIGNAGSTGITRDCT